MVLHGMRCGLGNLFVISELNSAIVFLSRKNMIALFSSEITNMDFKVHISSQNHELLSMALCNQ